ncbi:MAG: RNA polymerase sigma-54 factor [Candidatus Cloacimonadota bacterium]|nr:MAG: RNA polymerase sigma-54 factor [Candidatus Cloacimonadota bacterium]
MRQRIISNQSISQKHVQKLTIHQIQALKILEKPILELELAIKQEIIENPVLEIREELQESTEDVDRLELKEDKNSDNKLLEEIRQLSEILDYWDEIRKTERSYESKNQAYSMNYEEYERKDPLVNGWEIFYKQFYNLPLNKEERMFGEAIIGNIDEYGYLNMDLDTLDESGSISTQRRKAIHSMILGLSPKGIGARNLKECLMAQLDNELKNDKVIVSIIENNLELLIHNDIKKISRKYHISYEDAMKIKNIISHLDPKPGVRIVQQHQQYIIPDIIVRKIDNEFDIILNEARIPRLVINQNYIKMLSSAKLKMEELDYIKNKVSSAQSFIKSIFMRRNTLYEITKEIINHQPKFFIEEKLHLLPMTYEDISSSINKGISTISRAIKGKYIDTPLGMYKIKWFFSNKIEKCISTQFIKEQIRNLIENEDKANPYKDENIMNLLADKGLKISIRTVAKYRNQMKILNYRYRKEG